MYDRTRATYQTATWGQRGKIRPGIQVGEFDPGGIGPDIGKRVRVLDVRAPTDEPSVQSRPMTMYLLPTVVYDPGTAGPLNAAPIRFLKAVLDTGAGGVSIFEEQAIPAHGVALHLGADSLRVYIIYEPPAALVVANSLTALAGFDVLAAATISQLDRQDSLVTSDRLEAAATQDLDIPNFATTLQLASAALSVFDIVWLDQFGEVAEGTGIQNGTEFAAPVPIPTHASQVQLINASGVITDVLTLRFGRGA